MQKIKPKKVLGVDYGVKRIGLALSDERKIIASPCMTMTCERNLKETVKKFIKTIGELETAQNMTVETIVIGMPYMLSGKMSLMGDEVTHFIEILKTLSSTPIITLDERLTTALAERSLKEGDMSRKKRAKVVDTIAASLVLQSYLDHMGYHEPRTPSP